MVTWTGRYYGAPFQGLRRVTQLNLLSPTILNIVVDAMILHWVTIIVGGGQEQRVSDEPSSGYWSF